MITRRSFLKAGLFTATGVGLGTYWLNPFKKKSLANTFDASPFAQVKGDLSLTGFLGDNPERAHEVLWDKMKYVARHGGMPWSSEKASVVVIGGGMSGLSSAYFLREFKPILLEQAFQFGGNSKGEKWNEIFYSIGAAYISKPTEGAPSTTLLSELKLIQSRREDGSDAHVFMSGENKIVAPLWKGATDPARRAQFESAYKTFMKVGAQQYPDIPWRESTQISKSLFDELDVSSFDEWIKNHLPDTHPHILEFLEEYCWSSFGGSALEISAAQALSFLTADLGGTVVFPGGNAAIAEAIYKKLLATLPQDHLRAGCIVADVEVNQDGVRVTYSQNGELKSIQAKACIFAAPKFVAKHVIKDIPSDQLGAMAQIKYRAYLVANILLHKKIKSPSYELFRLTGNSITDPAADSKLRPFTDAIFGNWAAHDISDNSVLTLYRGFPYEGARAELYSSGSYEKAKKEFEDSIPNLLKVLNLTESDVSSLRISRWGHALPLAEKGLLANGVLERASASIQSKIFFAHQDNWANPCFETAVGVAFNASQHIRNSLI